MSRKQFKSEAGDYKATAINYDSYMGMPAVKTHLDFETEGKNILSPVIICLTWGMRLLFS